MKCKGLHQGMSSVVLCAGTGSLWCTSNSIMKRQNKEETALNCATGTTLWVIIITDAHIVSQEARLPFVQIKQPQPTRIQTATKLTYLKFLIVYLNGPTYHDTNPCRCPLGTQNITAVIHKLSGLYETILYVIHLYSCIKWEGKVQSSSESQ